MFQLVERASRICWCCLDLCPYFLRRNQKLRALHLRWLLWPTKCISFQQSRRLKLCDLQEAWAQMGDLRCSIHCVCRSWNVCRRCSLSHIFCPPMLLLPYDTCHHRCQRFCHLQPFWRSCSPLLQIWFHLCLCWSRYRACNDELHPYDKVCFARSRLSGRICHEWSSWCLS